MSFGWNTESALLPSKAKKIEVDSKSMMSLKAIVYQKEQQAAGGHAAGGHRGKRGAHATDAVSSSSGTDELFSRSNAGVDGRAERDEVERQAERRTKEKSQAALQRKAELYEKLKRGDVADPSKHGFLVDFEQRPSADGDEGFREGGDGGGHAGERDEVLPAGVTGAGGRKRGLEAVAGQMGAEHTGNDEKGGDQPRPQVRNGEEEGEEEEEEEEEDADGMVEITDDFGRSRRVLKRSREHMEYREEQRRKRQRQRQHAGMGTEEAEDADAAAARGYRHEPSAQPHMPPPTLEQQWPVSSGANRGDGGGDWQLGYADAAAERGKGMKDFEDGRFEGNRPGDDEPKALNGYVKSRWEQHRLNAQEKEYIKQIAAETRDGRDRAAAAGDEGGGRRDPKAERREMLRKKMEARKKKRGGGA